MPRTLPIVPQLIPSQTCLACRVCCHFPERTSALRPYFSGDEIAAAVDRGIDPAAFPSKDGGRIEVVPDPAGHGFLCPAYDPQTSECRIYDQRPLDCRLYPAMLMWNPAGDEVVLGWDPNCPFVAPPEVRGPFAERLARLIETEYLGAIVASPDVIGAYQTDIA